MMSCPLCRPSELLTGRHKLLNAGDGRNHLGLREEESVTKETLLVKSGF